MPTHTHRYISEIESDEIGELDNVRSVLKELGLDKVATDFDCLVLRYICEVISTRASVLAAAGVASLLNKVSGTDDDVGKTKTTFTLFGEPAAAS